MSTKEMQKAEADGAMARPSFIPRDTTGTEHITREEMSIARLALAQQMSPEINPSKPNFVEGLQIGQIFNSLTGRIYGLGPLEFYILRSYPPRFVEFIPREAGGGVKDPNVHPNDPRTQFGPNGEKPIATKFYDYLVVLTPVDPNEPLNSLVALSFKSTGLKVGRKLNGLIKSRQAPIYAGRYSVVSVEETNKLGTFRNFAVKNAGWAESPEDVAMLKKLSAEFADKTVAIHRDEDDDPVAGAAAAQEEEGDASFDTSQM